MIRPAFWVSCLRQSIVELLALPRCDQSSLRSSFSISAAVLSLALLATCLALSAGAQSGEAIRATIDTTATVALPDHVAPQILEGRTTLLGHYNPEQKLRLTLAIKPPHLAEEEEFLRELTDRGSPNFHAFLTPEEWNARFAPSAEDEQAVVDWAQSQGMTVTHRFNHRLLVDLEAPAGVIEKAFGVTINSYQYRDEVDFSNDRDPVIPARLSGLVFSIQGLNNIQHEHNNRPGPQTKGADYAEGPAVAAGPHDQADAPAPGHPVPTAPASNDVSNSIFDANGYLSPQGLFNSEVYNYDGLQNLGHCCNPHNDSGGAPNVSDIAIAAFGNFKGSDITGFQASFPYLAYNYGSWLIDGSIDCTSDPGDCPSGETTQDTEYTIATANSFGSGNNTAKVDVYIGANYNNGTFTDLYGYMLSNNTERVFSTSWSCTENYGCSTSTMDSRHNIFSNMIGQGWTLIAASGDRGSSDDCYLNSSNVYNTAHESVAYPGSDYDVLAAGGTKLQMYNNGTWDYEHAWEGGTSYGSCGHNNGGSGGGISSYYSIQGWQSDFLSGSKRQTPDISLNALGIGQSLYFNGSLGCCANGTSISAPELAGFFAQENAYLNYIGHICGSGGTSSCTPVGNPMPWFYAAGHYADASHNPFYDMKGNYCNSNDVTAAQSLGFYCTGSGWDNVTGWGSANMLQLAWAINWQLIPANGTPSISWTGGPATGHWYNSDQQISWQVNDYGGGTFPGTGIAGFTQGWDSLTPDSYSQPHGGTNDTYYWGPEYPNYTDGCMTLVGNSTCPGGVSQGCHTAHVRGWNNQGWTTGDQTYGPVCYDTVAPTISDGTVPATSYAAWVNKPVVVTLTATDPGGSNASGIRKTYYAIDTGSCYPGSVGPCNVYTGPFTVSAQGQHYVYYWTQDNAGNASAEPYQWISIDETPPVTGVSVFNGPKLPHSNRYRATVTLTPTDQYSGVAGTYYFIFFSDGQPTQQDYYRAPIQLVLKGPAEIYFYSWDNAGNVENYKRALF